METIEQKKRRVFGKQYLSEYLKELNALTNINITADMLLSIVESDSVGTVTKEYSYKLTINFYDKETLLLLVRQLINLKDGPCYLYTAYSTDCGILKLSSLKDFNINFNFDDEHAGLLKLTLEDLSNELVLDFYEENDEYYLEIEIFGKQWAKANTEE